MKTITVKWVVKDEEVDEMNMCLETCFENTSMNDYYCHEWSESDSTKDEVKEYKSYMKYVDGVLNK